MEEGINRLNVCYIAFMTWYDARFTNYMIGPS